MRFFLIVFVFLILMVVFGEFLLQQCDVVVCVDNVFVWCFGVEFVIVDVEKIVLSVDLFGFVVCGCVFENEQGVGCRIECFFVVVFGNFVILDWDGDSFLDVYWKCYGC